MLNNQDVVMVLTPVWCKRDENNNMKKYFVIDDVEIERV